MKPTEDRRSSGAFGTLLRLLPARFRARYGEELAELFHTQRGDARRRGRAALVRLWFTAVAGLVATAVRLNARDLASDARYAVRQILRRPGFALAVVLTLALGIGATTAVFSAVDAVVINSLPYPDADRLVVVQEEVSGTAPGSMPFYPPTYAEIEAIAQATDIVESIVGFSPSGSNVTGGDFPEWVLVGAATTSVLKTLGLVPSLGRGFEPDDTDVVILTDALWRRLFGARPDVLGSTVVVDGTPYTIVGVLPKGVDVLQGLIRGRYEMLRPLGPRDAPAGAGMAGRRMWAIARLAKDVTAEAAAARLEPIAAAAREAAPNALPAGATARLFVAPYRERIVGRAATRLWLLLGAAAFVLLIACVNVSNLFLTRAIGRGREIAVRRALGADRFHVSRLFVVESLLLSLAGVAAGLALAYWLVTLLRSANPRSLPRLVEIALDWRTVGVAVVIGVGASVAFGLLPLARWRRTELSATLKLDEPAGRSALLGRSLVVTEVALCLMLLAGAGLLTRTFLVLYERDLGYDSRNVLSLYLALRRDAYADASNQRTFMRRVREALLATPGIRGVGLVDFPLGEGTGMQAAVTFQPASGPSSTARVASRTISPGYLESVGIPLLRGRDFSNADNPESAPAFLISRALAGRLWPDADALGRMLTVNGKEGTIVGITGDVRYTLTAEDVTGTVYRAFDQAPSSSANLMVKTSTAPLPFVEVVRRVVSGLDPDQSVHLPPTMTTLDERLASSVADRWTVLLFLASFSGVALLLASVGLYGLLAHGVRARRRELGIRLALGARDEQLFGMVLAQGLWLTVAGLAAGVAGALGLTRFLGSLLVDVSTTDPPALSAAVVVLLAVATLACAVPARRAMRVDPLESLRAE